MKPDGSRRLSEIPTDTMSMAAALLSAQNGISWTRAREILEANIRNCNFTSIWNMASAAIDHAPYLEQLHAERVAALVFWVGVEAEMVE